MPCSLAELPTVTPDAELTGSLWAVQAAVVEKPEEPQGVGGFERVSYSNPLGRRSVTAQTQVCAQSPDQSSCTGQPAARISQSSHPAFLRLWSADQPTGRIFVHCIA